MQQALRGSVAGIVLGLLLAGCGLSPAPQSTGAPRSGSITATPVPGSSRSPLLLCGHDYSGAMIPYVVDATSSNSVAIPAGEKVVLRLSNDCSHGTAVQVVPGSALSLSQYLPDQAHAVAVWASSPTGDSTLRLTAANGQVRTLTVRAAPGQPSSSPSGRP